ncbi:MAG TPA: hypothetical protein RWO09_08375 [Ruminococcus sp.]
MKNTFNHSVDTKTRAKKIMADVTSGKKLQHIMINSAPEFKDVQDLYLNSLTEWFHHPKCEIVFEAKGEIN